MPQLAIVIPAYKADYLDQTLASIAAQTCQDFNLYLGCDGPNAEIDAIAEKWKGKLPLHYHCFEENLGKKDLVAQWNRTLALKGDEPFFTPFGDDDLMEPNCVEAFYKTLQTEPQYDVYHWNLKIINADGSIKAVPTPFPEHLDSFDYFVKNNVVHTISTRIPEFIFRHSAFTQTGGYVWFPFGMFTDHATVMRCSKGTGIRTMPDACVRWRNSGKNVSSNDAKAIALQEAHMQWNIDIFDFADTLYGKEETDKYSKERMDFLLRDFAGPSLSVPMKRRKEILLGWREFKENPKLVERLPYIRWKIKTELAVKGFIKRLIHYKN